MFNEYSEKLGKHITPHDLRDFSCSYAINSGMSVHDIANQACHSNIHTTLLYSNLLYYLLQANYHLILFWEAGWTLGT
ncbi:site-specific integrase [Bacillus cihuensis]|uniref:site-specific integrase n=1 Tax=Bacillus cihuensis TaxID=1208599 RepID=UPI000A03E88E|nr:site-specific integrase [Bacillus cihuensis]